MGLSAQAVGRSSRSPSGQIIGIAAVEKLRDEIMQAEETRSDLLKWKLGLVGAVGAAGLGFAGSVELRHADLVLCVLPPVALYVDLLTLHLTLRIQVIGAFLATAIDQESSVYRDYERFAHRMRHLDARDRSAFALEDWALFYSTYGLAAAVAGYGVFQLLDRSVFGVPFVLSGVVGVAGALVGGRQYTARCEAVDHFKPTGESGAP